jgi:hypothetical protein
MKDESKKEISKSLKNSPTETDGSGLVINISHQLVYPKHKPVIDEPHFPGYQRNLYEMNHPYPLPFLNQFDSQISKGFINNIQQPGFQATPYELYLPDFSHRNAVDNHTSKWKTVNNPTPIPDIQMQQSHIRPEEQKQAFSEAPRPNLRPGFTKPSSLVVNQEISSKDPNFFEECFSPKRTRKLSIDSDESLDLQRKKLMRIEDEDESKDILKVSNLLTIENKMHMRESGPHDRNFKMERQDYRPIKIDQNDRSHIPESINGKPISFETGKTSLQNLIQNFGLKEQRMGFSHKESVLTQSAASEGKFNVQPHSHNMLNSEKHFPQLSFELHQIKLSVRYKIRKDQAFLI